MFKNTRTIYSLSLETAETCIMKAQTARRQRGSTRQEGPVARHWFVLCLWSKVAAESVLTSAHAGSTHGQCIYKPAGLNWFRQWLNSVTALLIIIPTQEKKEWPKFSTQGPIVSSWSTVVFVLSLSLSLSLSLPPSLSPSSLALHCVIECDSLSPQSHLSVLPSPGNNVI